MEKVVYFEMMPSKTCYNVVTSCRDVDTDVACFSCPTVTSRPSTVRPRLTVIPPNLSLIASQVRRETSTTGPVIMDTFGLRAVTGTARSASRPARDLLDLQEGTLTLQEDLQDLQDLTSAGESGAGTTVRATPATAPTSV